MVDHMQCWHMGDTKFSTTLRNPRERLTPWYSCTRGTRVPPYGVLEYLLEPLHIRSDVCFFLLVVEILCQLQILYPWAIWKDYCCFTAPQQLRSLSTAFSIHTDSDLSGILVFELSVRHTAPTNHLSASGKLLVYYRTLLNVAQHDTNRYQDTASRLLIRPS